MLRWFVPFVYLSLYISIFKYISFLVSFVVPISFHYLIFVYKNSQRSFLTIIFYWGGYFHLFICISIYVYIGNFLFIVFLVMHIFFHLSICISSILCSPSFSVHLFIHLNTLVYFWPFVYSIRWRGTADNWPEIWTSFSCDSTVKPQGTAIKILSVR